MFRVVVMISRYVVSCYAAATGIASVRPEVLLLVVLVLLMLLR